MKNPIEYSLWVECLYRCIEKAKGEHKDSVDFKDVDEMVIAESKTIVEWKTNVGVYSGASLL